MSYLTDIINCRVSFIENYDIPEYVLNAKEVQYEREGKVFNVKISRTPIYVGHESCVRRVVYMVYGDDGLVHFVTEKELMPK